MNISIKIGIIVVIVIVAGILASPLFYETEVNEQLPTLLDEIEPGLTYDKFTQMPHTQRQPIIDKMSDDLKEMMMAEASQITRPVSETVDDMTKSEILILKSGIFVGLVGHDAQGLAKIIQVNDKQFLRFENFQVTNGPDLRVYLTSDGDVKNGIHIDKLKGSRGDQNYLLEGIDVNNYDTVVIYCQPFGVFFGEAKLITE